MSALDVIFARLWDSYTAITPQALAIHRLLRTRGETIENDHIALRTFDRAPIRLDDLIRPFCALGYQACGEYTFPEKKLYARHFERPGSPKIFVSEFLVDEFSPELRRNVDAMLTHVRANDVANIGFTCAGRPWPVSYAIYQTLVRESEYAAWVAAFGFVPNHFTINVNALRTFADLRSLNAFLLDSGFSLNRSGGEIKGSPAEFLEQSSTMADAVDVAFSDGVVRIPSCYYEFARRYRLPNGEVFQGFVAGSADKIFESTNVKP